MSELINKIKKIKGAGYIAVGLAAALFMLLWPSPSAETESVALSADEYRISLETQTAEMIKTLTGNRSVSVQIILESGYEYTFASDKYVTSDASGTREAKSEIFATGSGDAVVAKQKPPTVSSVAVVCRGADAGQRLKITEMISALYGIGSNRISVQT